jgi:hypothetical protein
VSLNLSPGPLALHIILLQTFHNAMCIPIVTIVVISAVLQKTAYKVGRRIYCKIHGPMLLENMFSKILKFLSPSCERKFDL